MVCVGVRVVTDRKSVVKVLDVTPPFSCATCVCMYVCMYVRMHACMYVCIYTHICMYICVCVCVWMCAEGA